VRRTAALTSSAAEAPPAAGTRRPGETADDTGGRSTAGSPVIVLSYLYSGADRVQDAIAAGTDWACTSFTGIVPLCAAAAQTWRQVEGEREAGISRLAVATIRGLVTAQVTAILASAGRTRWCELAGAPASVAESFLQIFPGSQFVCVHRACPEVVRTAIQASPWGLQNQALTPYLLNFPGNSVAALAAYWANSAEQLLAFEQANRGVTRRVRYEDVTSGKGHAPGPVSMPAQPGEVNQHTAAPPRDELSPSDPAVPADPQLMPPKLIPGPLRERVDRLHRELGYPPLES
jgi:hypothetical protein